MGMYAPFSFPIAEDMVTCVVLWPMKRCLFHLHRHIFFLTSRQHGHEAKRQHKCIDKFLHA